MLFTFLMIYFACVINSSAELYNLYGKAGQAYSLQVNLGHPYQDLYFLVDTGSTTLAVASQPDQESDIYFRANRSNSIFKSGKDVQARYSSGRWWGKLASDYMNFPSLTYVPEVRTDIALITKSENFFMNGQGWQGILGLAYLPVGAWGEYVIVESWLDSLDRTIGKPMSFQMKLCGPQSVSNATHYGKFNMLDDQTPNQNYNKTFKTPIIRKSWYEVGVISIRVIENTNRSNQGQVKPLNENKDSGVDLNVEMCQKLNEQKSIIDSGTTNIKIPEAFFRQVVDRLRDAAQASDVLILDDFWYHGVAACWPEPQQWSLPYLAIDLLSADAEDQYFTLEIPSQNYMRVVKARNNTVQDGLVSEYCYELGLASATETVLGYTAMEGFEVLFNRSAGWIGFQTSSCGSNTRITGPYNATSKLTDTCALYKPMYEVATSVKVVQWALLGVSIIASGVLVYVLAPCVRMLLVKRLTGAQQMSLSQAALVEREASS